MTKGDEIYNLLRDKEFCEFELKIGAAPPWKLEDYEEQLRGICIRLKELGYSA